MPPSAAPAPRQGAPEPRRARACILRAGVPDRHEAAASLDKLVRALLEEQRYIDAERVRCSKIDDQLEFRGLLYWHVCGFIALENFLHKKSAATKQGGTVRTERH